jgi:hypothetical protein
MHMMKPSALRNDRAVVAVLGHPGLAIQIKMSA